MSIFHIIIIAVLTIFLLFALFIIPLIILLKRRSQTILEKYDPASIILSYKLANCFGQESKGLIQMRGNGVLVLTKAGLHFHQYIPSREIAIPIHSMISVDQVKSHLRKTVMRPLLRVSYTNTEGQPDRCAWYVTQLDQWISGIQSLLSGK